MGTAGLLGVVLAGGAARRMGADKALVAVGGTPMIARVTAALATVTPEVIVSGRAEGWGGYPGLADDRPARRGPLAGLATALGASGGRPVLLVAVDQPLVRAATLRALASRAAPDRAVLPVDGGARQVTCAVYPGAWAAEAAAEDEAGGSIQSLLDRMPCVEIAPAEWRAWGEDGRSWLSVDAAADVARAEALLAGA